MEHLKDDATVRTYNHKGTFVSQWGAADFRSDAFVDFLRESVSSVKAFDTGWQSVKKEITYFRIMRNVQGQWTINVSNHIDTGVALIDDAWYSVHGEHAPGEILESAETRDSLLESVQTQAVSTETFHDGEIRPDTEKIPGDLTSEEIDEVIGEIKSKLRALSNASRNKTTENFEKLKSRVEDMA